MSDIENKYISCFLLHALGDTLGFKNGDWEFDYNKETSLDTVNEYIYEFIELGGINGIDLEDWKISDDTFYHIAIADSMLKYKGKIDDKFSLLVKNNLAEMHNKMIDDENIGIYRYPGKTTNKIIEKFTDTNDGRNMQYNKMSGGNGACMRNLCIGLVLCEERQIDELIEASIELSKITHNSALGYLSGFTSSYFASLALRGVDILKWPFYLVSMLESNKIKKKNWK